MKKSRNYILYLIAGVLIITAAAVSANKILKDRYRRQIPSPSSVQINSDQINKQVSSAYKKAWARPSAENIGMLGMAYNSNEFYREAADCYKIAITRDKAEWKWNYYLGFLDLEMGETHSAIKNFRNVTDKKPDMFQAWYYEAGSYQKSGNRDSAGLAFNRIISHMDKNQIVRTPVRYDYFPLVTYSMYQLARISFDDGKIDPSEQTLLRIVNDQRAFGPAYRLLGNIYLAKGDKDLSNRYLVRANDLPGNQTPVDTLVDRLSLMSRSGQYILKKIDEAEKNVFPEYALELVNHGLSYIKDDNYLIAKAIRLYIIRNSADKALPYLDRHLAYFSKDYNELKGVADLLYEKGYFPEAMKYYSKVIELDPEDIKVQSCMAICLAKSGKRSEAIDLVNTIIDKNKKSPGAIADGVTLLLNLGETDKARLALISLRRLSPSFPKGLQVEGIMAEKEGNNNDAIKYYESAFKGDPKDLTTIRLLGNLLVKQKLWEKAIAHYRRSLEYYPNEAFLLERLGTLLVTCPDTKLRNINEGRDYCERAFIHNASQSATLISAGRSLAIAYRELGDMQNSSNILKMTINLAKSQNFPAAYISGLERLFQR
jgi:tetratricopeptide (TPR) repeat protein